MSESDTDEQSTVMEAGFPKKLYFRNLRPESLSLNDFKRYIKEVGFLTEHLESTLLFDDNVLNDPENRARIVQNINGSYSTLDIGGN